MQSLARGKMVLAALLVMSLAGYATGTLAGQARASDNVAPQGGSAVTDRTVGAWVEKRVQEWQITAAERKFDEIGWAKDIRDALRLAKLHRRPVFLFTHDGRMAIGRC